MPRYNELTPERECELVEQCRSGDREAMSEILLNLKKRIAQVCYQSLGFAARDELADAVQSVTVEVIKAIPKFDSSQGVRLETFLAPRMHGACLDYMRSMLPPGARRSKEFRRKTTSLDGLVYDDGKPVADMATDADAFNESMDWMLGSDVVEAIAERAGEVPGQIVRLYFLNGITMREIGERLGISESRVSQIMSRTLADLRQRAEVGGWNIHEGQFGNYRKGETVTMEATQNNNAYRVPGLTQAALAICNATKDDVADLDERIADAERQVSMLKTLRKLVTQRLGTDQRAAAQPKQRAPQGALAKEIVDLLSEQGTLSLDEVSQRLGKYKSVIAMALPRIASVRREGEMLSIQ